MIICTTSISQPFKVIDVIFVFHGEESKGVLGIGGIHMEKAMNSVKAELAKKARALGADAVIGVDFEKRVAVSGGLVDKQVLEIFAFGTAVKLLTDANFAISTDQFQKVQNSEGYESANQNVKDMTKDEKKAFLWDVTDATRISPVLRERFLTVIDAKQEVLGSKTTIHHRGKTMVFYSQGDYDSWCKKTARELILELATS
jgi:uncharacterized protein YbjQ (UPF0145 family)